MTNPSNGPAYVKGRVLYSKEDPMSQGASPETALERDPEAAVLSFRSSPSSSDGGIPLAEMDAWLEAMKVAISSNPPRQWASFDRHSDLWAMGKSLFYRGLAGESLAPTQEALALSYVNSRNEGDVSEDILKNLRITPEMSKAVRGEGGRLSVENSLRVWRAQDILEMVFRPFNRLRRSLNRVPLRILLLGPMELGDALFLVVGALAAIVLAGQLAIATGVWHPSS